MHQSQLSSTMRVPRGRRLSIEEAKGATAETLDDQQFSARVERDNPIYRVFSDRSMLQEERVKKISELLKFDLAGAGNAKKIEALGDFFKHVQLQRYKAALEHVNTVGNHTRFTFNQNIDSVFDLLNAFKSSLEPLGEVLGQLEVLNVLNAFGVGELFDQNMRSVVESGVQFITGAGISIDASIEVLATVRDNILKVSNFSNQASTVIATTQEAIELSAAQNKAVVNELVSQLKDLEARSAPATDLAAAIERTKAKNRIKDMNQFLAGLDDLGVSFARAADGVAQQGAAIADLERKNNSAMSYMMCVRSQVAATVSTRVVTLLKAIVNAALAEKAALIGRALDRVMQEVPELEAQASDFRGLSDAVSEATVDLVEALKQAHVLVDAVKRSAGQLNQVTLGGD